MGPEIFSSTSETSPEEGFFSLKEPFGIPKTNISFAFQTWGKPEGIAPLVTRFALDEEEIETIKAIGIPQHHRPWPPLQRKEDDPLFPSEEVARLRSIAVNCVTQALEVNNWQGLKRLVFTSSLLPSPDFPEQVTSQLNQSGIKVGELKHYYLACNGAVASLHDILRDETLAKEAPVAILSLEPVSFAVDYEKDLVNSVIFDSLATCMAFSPGDFKLKAGKTVIFPSEDVIRAPQTYNLPAKEECQIPPAWYELKEGAEKVFAYSQRGVVMLLPASSSPYYLEMDESTAKLFLRIVPPVIYSVLEDYYSKGVSRPDTLLVVSHQPNAGLLERLGNGKKIIRMLEKANLPKLKVPWVLDKVGVGNSVSGTPLTAFAQLAKEGRLARGEDFLFLGFGAGPSVAAMVIQIQATSFF